jgi:ADP-heptose:LPS heptosyltransferase
MRRIILSNYQAPGDILMLTAAVRDLHRCHPGEYVTDVRTSCPALWENNPWLTPLQSREPGVESLHCKYPLIHRSEQGARHFIYGFMDFLNERLGTRVVPTSFRGDIHLSEAEQRAASPLAALVGAAPIPYWIIVAGGKFDYTIKWWNFRRWQAVVDHFRGRLLFVQVGKGGDYHPPLKSVVDLRGRTSLREMVLLTRHAEGVLCPVTFSMHLAAAVPLAHRSSGERPCVVVAGGRESPHWEAYPAHQFLHTVGALSCCDTGGCWRSRVAPLGDGDNKDGAEHLCVDVVRGLPRCMDLITPEQVAERIEYYLAGGRCDTLTAEQERLTEPFLTDEHPAPGRSRAAPAKPLFSEQQPGTKAIESNHNINNTTHVCHSM